MKATPYFDEMRVPQIQHAQAQSSYVFRKSCKGNVSNPCMYTKDTCEKAFKLCGIFVLLIAFSLLSGCRSGLNLFGSSAPLTAKVKYDIQVGTDSHSLSGDLLLMPDEILTLSFAVPFLGIEAARVQATPQSITILDRLNRRYLQEPLDSLTQIAGRPISFADIQAFFLSQEAKNALVSSAIFTLPSAGKPLSLNMSFTPTKLSKKASKKVTPLEVSSRYERITLQQALRAAQILFNQQ